MSEILYTAEDPESDIEVVNKNLFVGVSTRPTKHVLRFTSEATPEYREFITEQIEDSNFEFEVDGDEIVLLSE
jgi:hypothetical protein